MIIQDLDSGGVIFVSKEELPKYGLTENGVTRILFNIDDRSVSVNGCSAIPYYEFIKSVSCYNSDSDIHIFNELIKQRIRLHIKSCDDVSREGMQFSDDEISYITSSYENGISPEVIASNLKRSYYAVTGKAMRLRKDGKLKYSEPSDKEYKGNTLNYTIAEPYALSKVLGKTKKTISEILKDIKDDTGKDMSARTFIRIMNKVKRNQRG